MNPQGAHSLDQCVQDVHRGLCVVEGAMIGCGLRAKQRSQTGQLVVRRFVAGHHLPG